MIPSKNNLVSVLKVEGYNGTRSNYWKILCQQAPKAFFNPRFSKIWLILSIQKSIYSRSKGWVTHDLNLFHEFLKPHFLEHSLELAWKFWCFKWPLNDVSAVLMDKTHKRKFDPFNGFVFHHYFLLVTSGIILKYFLVNSQTLVSLVVEKITTSKSKGSFVACRFLPMQERQMFEDLSWILLQVLQLHCSFYLMQGCEEPSV